ncbi:hypothetical protein HOC35_07385 [Candidatus Woesearchaeota archaeon]|jgi:hypothetical protein|nr:hypothetical protein [Candidatus Woesearchaeota archaeon]
MKQKVAKDTPLMELTLRRYERPDKMEPRNLIKKFCLSVGLLQPGDSRDIIVDILYVLLRAKSDQRIMTSEQVNIEVRKLREEHNLVLLGVAPSNVRRQIKRLRDLLLVEKIRNNYRIHEFSPLSDSYKEKFEQYLLPSVVSRINEYFREIDRVFN